MQGCSYCGPACANFLVDWLRQGRSKQRRQSTPGLRQTRSAEANTGIGQSPADESAGGCRAPRPGASLGIRAACMGGDTGERDPPRRSTAAGAGVDPEIRNHRHRWPDRGEGLVRDHPGSEDLSTSLVYTTKVSIQYLEVHPLQNGSVRIWARLKNLQGAECKIEIGCSFRTNKNLDGSTVAFYQIAIPEDYIDIFFVSPRENIVSYTFLVRDARPQGEHGDSPGRQSLNGPPVDSRIPGSLGSCRT